MKIGFDPEAISEAREASAFYEGCQAGLGRAFAEEIEAATLEVSRHPLM